MNKLFIDSSFFKSLPRVVQRSLENYKLRADRHQDFEKSLNIDFCNVSELDGIKFLERHIDYLSLLGVGHKRKQITKKCIEKWKESNQEVKVDERTYYQDKYHKAFNILYDLYNSLYGYQWIINNTNFDSMEFEKFERILQKYREINEEYESFVKKMKVVDYVQGINYKDSYE